MKELLARGFGTKVKQAEAIFPEDEEIIWEKGVFGAKNAETLQCTVFFYACKIFGLRGHDEHHDLMCDQFNLGEDANGKYVEFTGRSTKTYKGGLAQLELANKVVRHHCQPGERCIADYFRVHLEALGNNGKFYRRPLPGNPPRYGNQPVGVNKLKNMIKIICLRAGMEGNFTNHSGKRTCATQLYLADVDEQDIMSRTGHRSEKAVRKYKQSCSTVTKRVSKVLDPPAAKGSENDPPTAKGSENDESSSAKVRKIETPSTSENVKVPFSDITSRAYFNNCQISFNVDSKAK